MDPEIWTFLIFALVGAGAQLIDGALGMGYGVVSATILMSLGVPPANVSASVHAAKTATGAASAVSHIAHKNVDWKLLGILSAAGVVGGAIGAYVLTNIEGERIKPFIAAWLGIMGIIILWRAAKSVRPKVLPTGQPVAVGFVGGLLDAIGGGGWGPVVTSTLLGAGGEPRKVIGTTNAAEFFVATAIAATFLFALLTGGWEATGLRDLGWSVAGLIAGGIVVAPIAGWTTKVLPLQLLTWFVGVLVVVLAAWQGYQIWRS